MSGNNENYRDISQFQWTDTDVEAFRPLFKSMKTYNSEGDYICTTEFKELFRLMKYERTEEQLKTYEEFWAKFYDGKMTWDFFTKGVRTLHDSSLVASFHATQIDKNGDGFIQEDEFLALLEMMIKHEPKLTGKAYTDFVTEADTNKDGQVSIEECGDWVAKYIKV